MTKILVVDDSQAQAQFTRTVLEQAGYGSAVVHDPLRVEDAIQRERPALILLDVVMPNRNGFQVCRELKAQPEFAGIPVVLVTSKNTPSDRFWGQQQGADGHVGKPFSPEELLGAVAKFVGPAPFARGAAGR